MLRAAPLNLLLGFILLATLVLQPPFSFAQSTTIQQCVEERTAINTGEVVRRSVFYSYADPWSGLQDVYAIDTTLPDTPNARSICRRYFSDVQNNAAFVQAGDDTFLMELRRVPSDARAAALTTQSCFSQLTGTVGQPPLSSLIAPQTLFSAANSETTSAPVLNPPVQFLLVPSFIGIIPQLHGSLVPLPLVALPNERGFQFNVPLDWLPDNLAFINGQIVPAQADWIVNYYTSQMAGWQLLAGSLVMGLNGDTFVFTLVDGSGAELYFQFVLSSSTRMLQVAVAAPEPRWGGGQGNIIGNGLVGANLNSSSKDILINQMTTLVLALFASNSYEVYIQQDSADPSIQRYLEFELAPDGTYAIMRNETVRQSSTSCTLPDWIPAVP